MEIDFRKCHFFLKLFPAIRFNLFFFLRKKRKGFPLLSGLGHSVKQNDSSKKQIIRFKVNTNPFI